MESLPNSSYDCQKNVKQTLEKNEIFYVFALLLNPLFTNISITVYHITNLRKWVN